MNDYSSKPIDPLPAHLNPVRAMPATQVERSIDPPDVGGGDGGGGGGTTGDWPLKLVKVDTQNVKVLLGTVAGFTPTTIETNIDVSGADGTWTIYMHASLSGSSVTGAEVLNDGGSGGVPADDGSNSYRLIGQVDVAGAVITAVRPSMAWSQNVVICTASTPPYNWMTGA